MTPTEEAEFIALWQQGLSHEVLAQRLGCPVGTVKSRASTLQRQGKITARPRGGTRPRGQATPSKTPAPPATTAPPVAPVPPAVTFVAVPDMQELLSLVKDLHARVGALEQTRVSPALPVAPASPVTPTPPAAERKEIQQWTVRLSKALIAHLKAVAYERRQPPSQLLEELLWQALDGRPSSTP